MSYYKKEYRRRLSLSEDGNALIMLIAINLVIFVIFAFIHVVYYVSLPKALAEVLFKKQIYDNLAIPASFTGLLQKPWTVISHMFYHENVWHIISNMLWLWAFGYILQDLTGNRKLIPIFLYSALLGAAAFMGSFHLIPSLKEGLDVANAVGASAGIMGIAVAVTMIAPGFRIFPMLNGGIPLWVVTMIFVIIDLATIPGTNSGGHIAHLGGALGGFLFIFFLRRGYDGSEWMNNLYDWFNNLFNPDKPARGSKKIKEQLFYKSKSQPYKKSLNLTQQRIDEILDKINQHGYNHLTEEEKELLKRASQEDLS